MRKKSARPVETSLSEMPNEECGVFGIFGWPEAAKHAYLGLYALQHRGQESAGIVASDGERLRWHRDMGRVAEVFTEDVLNRLEGEMAIGHVRYSTTGSSTKANAQPIVVNYARGQLAVAHNGDLVNTMEIRDELEKQGAIFSTTSDSEVLVHLVSRSRKKSFEDALVESLGVLRGAYSFVLLTQTQMIAVRDPQGFRPLSIGKLDGSYVVASETCAFDISGAEYVRDVEPGEMVVIDRGGLRSRRFAEAKPAYCIFEYVYYSRPDSIVFGHNVHDIRLRLGAQLACEYAVEADLVMPVPDSSNSAALGYSRESGIQFEFGFIRSHYIGRTFIEPSQQIRDFGAKLKYNPVRSVLEGKRVVVVDDSIVRGTTSRKIIKMIRGAGAREVHLRISCPPWKHPCFYGIDTPTKSELIGATHTVEEIQKYLRVDSLGYLSEEGLLRAMPEGSGPYCMACFKGRYPVPLGESILNGKQKILPFPAALDG
jgi:amidophosphoribosyltransferase